MPHPDLAVPLNEVIVGSWTIANTKSNTGYGADAIGFPTTGVFPDPAVLENVGVRIPTYDPSTLTDSSVIVLPLKFPGGSAVFVNEVGPLSKVTCDSTFVDNLEAAPSLPSLDLKCVNFNPISSATAVEGGDAPIIPDTFALDASGFLQLSNCRTSSGLLSGKKFIFAFMPRPSDRSARWRRASTRISSRRRIDHASVGEAGAPRLPDAREIPVGPTRVSPLRSVDAAHTGGIVKFS
jgi:hypothetical protein